MAMGLGGGGWVGGLTARVHLVAGDRDFLGVIVLLMLVGAVGVRGTPALVPAAVRRMHGVLGLAVAAWQGGGRGVFG